MSFNGLNYWNPKPEAMVKEFLTYWIFLFQKATNFMIISKDGNYFKFIHVIGILYTEPRLFKILYLH